MIVAYQEPGAISAFFRGAAAGGHCSAAIPRNERFGRGAWGVLEAFEALVIAAAVVSEARRLKAGYPESRAIWSP
jgi:hypothetical protein